MKSPYSKSPFIQAALLGGALCFALAAKPVSANDHIFPPAAEAKAAIDFDSKGFLIQGKRVFIASAGMEYARVPHQLWRDRLLRLKRAGFNCVEMYTFWDWHEPQAGKFDFQGDHDLDAYLKLVHQLGMYAICRVGPYYCAEWDSGGYPLWLRFTPGLKVRQDEPTFEAAVDRFFGRLIPIVAKNQINHGGAVILVQLENEGASWGTEEANPYFKHLREKAVSLGLQVPYFFSGLHHGGDPGSDTAMDDPKRPNPWFTTEFWSVWYDHYGAGPNDASDFGRRTWKIIAHGGNGYNYYMAHGGTNFAYTNNNEDAASYDYGAAVGQGGDLRPIYYTFKRAALFARSFQDILENSTDATGDYQTAVVSPGIKVTARKSPAGTLVFLDNPTKAPIQTLWTLPGETPLPAGGPITLAPGEILPLVRDFALLPGVTLQSSSARILGITTQGDTTTLVIYGPPGSPAELRFAAPGTPGSLLQAKFPVGEPAEYSFQVGPKRVRVLAMSDMLADRTWFVEAGTQTYVVCGPSYAGDLDTQGGALKLTTEQPWQGATAQPTLVYGPTGPVHRLRTPLGASAHPLAAALSGWQAKDASEAAAPDFDDHTWLASDAPQQMGADGDLTADAWYRASVTVPDAGAYQFHATGGDRAQVYVDGAKVGSGSLHGDLPLTLPAGKHTLAVFTAQDGRDKMFGYVGSIEKNDPKGLLGPVAIDKGGAAEVTGWRVLPAASADAVQAGPPAADAAGWQSYTIGADAFGHRAGFAWFQATLPASVGATRASLHFGSVDDNATVFVNGKEIGRHQGWDSAFDLPVTPGEAAVLTVFVENTAGTGGLDKPVRFSSQIGEGVTATNWKLRGGPGDPLSSSGWKPLGTADTFSGPAFFRTEFAAAPPDAVGPHPIWRVLFAGLGHGSVWVNGHNLGRYPEKIPINGLYIPESWLKSGKNSLVIYDEDGHRPDQVTVAAEAAASRDVSSVFSER